MSSKQKFFCAAFMIWCVSAAFLLHVCRRWNIYLNIIQCTSDGDKSECQQIAWQWIKRLDGEDIDLCVHSTNDSWIQRFFVMKYFDRDIRIGPTNPRAIDLCPITQLDTRVTALWLHDLLRRLHGNILVCSSSITEQLPLAHSVLFKALSGA